MTLRSYLKSKYGIPMEESDSYLPHNIETIDKVFSNNRDVSTPTSRRRIINEIKSQISIDKINYADWVVIGYRLGYKKDWAHFHYLKELEKDFSRDQMAEIALPLHDILRKHKIIPDDWIYLEFHPMDKGIFKKIKQ